MKRISLVLIIIGFSVVSQAMESLAAGEPAYCDPNKFANYERSFLINDIQRLRVFKIGELTLAGMAVGESKASDIESLAAVAGEVPKSEKSCTWYFNKGNLDAETAFTHRHVPNPHFLKNKTELVKAYSRVLESSFDRDPVNMVQCATKYKYVGMGCNGQRHRGPTVFAMLLAFSGCSPKNANKITKRIWGSNHVPSEHREAIAEAAYRWGTERPASRQALQALMLK